ncbi:DUF1883 domain-containing protein [Rhizobium sp. Root482]|uniref:DUF1883 domain-containing protein n=1 Tax=Rhizobium sp. Root482 TaxID=1736543 RepID=UPI0006F2CAE1|nr:DUF1883 domain-containing protein [Rhizobium sp. Root482]KQY14729.1 TIR protein [Rhizobium sp. Root482]
MTKLTFAFTHYDLKQQRGGATIEITLSAVANVRLMTDQNFALYKQAMKHQFVGGVAKKSPIRLVIPKAGHWHLVIDMEGHHGQSETSIRVIETAPSPRFQSTS